MRRTHPPRPPSRSPWPNGVGASAVELATANHKRRVQTRFGQHAGHRLRVVVVLPWAPAIAMPCLKRISSASISARGTTSFLFGERRLRGCHPAPQWRSLRRRLRPRYRQHDPTKVLIPRPARRRSVLYRRVGARNHIAQVILSLCNTAHAGAANADKMNVMNGVFHAANSPQAATTLRVSAAIFFASSARSTALRRLLLHIL